MTWQIVNIGHRLRGLRPRTPLRTILGGRRAENSVRRMPFWARGRFFLKGDITTSPAGGATKIGVGRVVAAGGGHHHRPIAQGRRGSARPRSDAARGLERDKVCYTPISPEKGGRTRASGALRVDSLWAGHDVRAGPKRRARDDEKGGICLTAARAEIVRLWGSYDSRNAYWQAPKTWLRRSRSRA